MASCPEANGLAFSAGSDRFVEFFPEEQEHGERVTTVHMEINRKVRSCAGGEGMEHGHASVAMPPGVMAPGAGGGGVSERVLRVAEMFGIGLDEGHEVVLYEALELEIRRGDVVYITGASGSGKSVLLRALAGEIGRQLALGAAGPEDPEGPVAVLEEVDAGGEAAVIDRFAGPLEEALRVLSVAGLSDAFAVLRRPSELSDGQRYRYRLARLLACGARTVVIDEFCSMLDRRTARALSHRIRKYADRTGTTFVVATAHDDLGEDLDPDVLVRKTATGVSLGGNACCSVG